MKGAHLLLLACIVALLAGCATVQKIEGSPTILRDVPFFSQEAYQCGPAALATVLNYWNRKTGAGAPIAVEEIVPEIFSPSAKGVLGIDLERYARKRGFQTRIVSGTTDELRSLIDAGVPSIILVDYGFLLYQRNHFMVVVGYARNGLVVNSGTVEREFISEEDLLSIWKKTGYWMLVVRP